MLKKISGFPCAYEVAEEKSNKIGTNKRIIHFLFTVFTVSLQNKSTKVGSILSQAK
jgi:hypothetical protein